MEHKNKLTSIYNSTTVLYTNIYNGNSYRLRNRETCLVLELNRIGVLRISPKPKTLVYLKQKLKKKVAKLEKKEEYEVFFSYE